MFTIPRALNTLVVLFLVAGCTKSDSPLQAERSATNPRLEDSEIKIIVFEYLIKLTTTSNSVPGRRSIFFADLSDQERGELLIRVKNCDLRTPKSAHLVKGKFIDTKTQEQGSALEIKSLDIAGSQAHVLAGYFTTAGVFFELSLTKRPGWRITKVSRPPLIIE